MKKSDESHGESASELVSKKIAELGDWRGETLARMRSLIKGASLKDPARLFNSSLDGNVRRAIALNSAGKAKAAKKPKS